MTRVDACRINWVKSKITSLEACFISKKKQIMKTNLKTIALAIFLSVISFNLNAQIEINWVVSPNDLITTILGEEIIIDNVHYIGAAIASGTYTGGSSIGLNSNSGIFLTTGSGELIPGPNSSCNTSVNNNMGGDPSLTAICGSSTYDAAVLQFDFCPVSDTFRINYIFGSEEYNENISGIYNNDGAAILITGPNPLGGYYSNLNITTVPDTDNLPITLSNINNGYALCGNFTSGPCTNCEYFIDNTDGTILEYDGYTVPMSGWVKVVPYETYHVKIAIADCMSAGRDSGLFIEGLDNMTRVENNNLSNIKIYPNPAAGEFRVSNIAGHSVKIRNTQGVVVKTFDQIYQSGIAITDLAPGFYFVEMEKDGYVETRKVVVK